MTEPADSNLFPTADPGEAERQRDVTTGLLPSQMLREAVALGRGILSPQPIGDDQIQPASTLAIRARSRPRLAVQLRINVIRQRN
jgi:hypothetical protein